MPQNIQPVLDLSKSRDLPFGYNVSDIHEGCEYHRLTVTKFAGRNKRGLLVWECKCKCGGTTLAYGRALIAGTKRSCGCLGREATSKRSKTHGMTHTITYKSWRSMRCRCEKSYDISYPRYGGRGIKVCERWQSFENFLSDMGERPSKDHQIERKDNNGNYTPDNCRWATRKEQARNRRSASIITYNGISKSITEWAEFLGCHPGRIHNRIRLGWSVDRIFATPIREHKKR